MEKGTRKEKIGDKKSNWTVTKLVANSTLGVLLLLLSLGGATISAVTGVPISSGFINVFVSGAMFAFCVLVIQKFGSATLMGFIYSLLAIPLPLFGSPGFAPKIFIGLIVGVVADIIYNILKFNKKAAAIAVGAITQLLIVLLTAGLGAALGMPGVEKLIKLFIKPLPLSAALILGGIAGAIGLWFYSKLENHTIIVRIQSGRGEIISGTDKKH